MNTAGAPKIRVLLADDHAVLRAGLRALLHMEPDMEVAGEANDGNEAIRLAEQLKPTVVVMDIEMRGGHGLQATGTIRGKDRHVRVLILSAHDDQGYLRQALRAGATGYLLKESAVTDLLTAIRTVYRGALFVDPSMMKGLLEEMRSPQSAAGPAPPLSQREREVLSLLARGHTVQGAADLLCLSVRTVETYKARLREKLGLRGR